MIDEARAECSGLQLEELDVTEHPGLALKYRVVATPAIAIDGRLEFVGVPREDALRARLHAAGSE